MLNGPTYPYSVKDFWVRVKVFDEVTADSEVRQKVVEDKRLLRDSFNY